jgi:dolichol-phosphate mannosyltransferase
MTGAVAVSVVLPVYNEEENLPELHNRLTEAVEPLGIPYEVIFVDDGSSDGSKAVMRELRCHDPRVKIIVFSRNFVHQAAVSAGINQASGDAVVVMDADLQDPPELLP